jgi:hypothetical protein
VTEKAGPAIADFSDEIAAEPIGPGRIVLAMAARQATALEIATALAISLEDLGSVFGRHLKLGRSLAIRNALNLLNRKAEAGNISALLFLLKRLETLDR